MIFSEFLNRNSNASRPEGPLRTVVIRELVSQIDINRVVPAKEVLRLSFESPVYADINVGDCDMGLLFDGGCLWGAYRCQGTCAFAGAWCWILLEPMSFGLYSAYAQATYQQRDDVDGFQACARHSFVLDIAIYTFLHDLDDTRLTTSAALE